MEKTHPLGEPQPSCSLLITSPFPLNLNLAYRYVLGDRYSWLRDPFGHMWAMSEIREVLTPEEVQERMQERMIL
jgi:hypothetical protein